MTARRTIAIVAALATPTVHQAQQRRLDLSDPGWTRSGAARIDTTDGRAVLRTRTGGASFAGVALRDGTIEFDMMVTPYRSFVYLDFRAQSPLEREEFYFRPHKSGLPDALQYAPVYRGVSNWQLYHGTGYTAAPRFVPNQWTHVRVVVQGNRAAVFIGAAATPAIVVRHLARDPAAGYIGLRSLLNDPGAPADLSAASFTNVVVTPGEVGFDFSTVEDRETMPPGAVTRWSVSAPFVAESLPPETLPQTIMSAAWRTLPTDHRGLVVFYRHLPRFRGDTVPSVLAAVRITSDRARTVPFDLGYSDAVTVFLNGRPLFHRDDSYSFDEPRREGLIGFDQARVYLPLRQGTNDLVLVVSDVFGGWGVMGRLPRGQGSRIGTRE